MALPDNSSLTHARWQALFNAARDAIVSIDAGGHITLFSPTVECMFGYPAPEVLGREVGLLMPPRYQDELRRGSRKAEKGFTASAHPP